MKRFALIFSLIIALPSLLHAQSWPVYENTFVNDYAAAIDEDAQTRIRRSLEVLREETGVEATVLTLYSRGGFQAAGSFEDFATGLFNHWGIGNAQRNDGILILVITQDREMRIELGAGYPGGFDREAKDIIERIFIPAFKNGNMSQGIEDGTDATLNRIARVHATGQDAPAPSGTISGLLAALLGLAGFASFGALIFRRRIGNSLRRCPKCHQRGLVKTKEIIEKATRKKSGEGKNILDCPHCHYHTSHLYTISRITASSSSSSGGSFGGGSSSGGGASGSW